LFEATGDPLALTEPDLAAQVYGLTEASRPSVALRKLRAAIFMNSTIPGLGLGLWLMERRGYSARRAAQEAVVLAAERGHFQTHAPTAAEEERLRWPIIRDERRLKSVIEAGGYGGAAMVAPFDTAVQRLQEAIIFYSRRQSDAQIGDTGRRLLVRIPDGITLRDPMTLERLPPGEHDVPDILYWRKRIAEGDALRVPHRRL